jgi:uncharacterized cofD-like protein
MEKLPTKRIVVVGGGTGTHTVLTGLKRYANIFNLTAVVAMTDSGGSTGRLRDEFGYLPVGDVRMALAALASEGDVHDALLRKLFLHRFATEGDIAGHNFGNLFLVALTDILGTEEAAIEAASRVLRVCGTVLPVTNECVNLVADYSDGVRVIGEHAIDEPTSDRAPHTITHLSLTPRAKLSEKARAALLGADLIVFGPGDLYTSVIANCVVDGFSDAMGETRAQMLYVANLMTKMGQTSGMGVREHVESLAQYAGRTPDYVLVNSTPLPEVLVQRYETESEYPVINNAEGGASKVIATDLLATEEIVRSKGDVLKRSLIRHDPYKLAEAIRGVLMG